MIAAYREFIQYLKAQQALTPAAFPFTIITPADTQPDMAYCLVTYRQLDQTPTLSHATAINNDMIEVTLIANKQKKASIFKAVEWLDTIITGRSIPQTSPNLCGDILCHTFRTGSIYVDGQGSLVMSCSWSLLTKQEFEL